ncbi:MAG: sigma-70 family RNA polymerase sigma factor [Ruminococcus sp.]|nr:sigma-70 family RNA polymerase sigma factor [Ruminococcus sp.]
MKKDIEEYYEKYGTKVYTYLLGLSGDCDTSRELTQETFVRAIGSLSSFSGNCSVSTWLCSIAKNLWRNEMRRRGLHPSADTDEAPPQPDLSQPSPDESLEQKDTKMFVLRQVHSLPETEKEIILLRATGAMTFAEIGELFGKTESWARVTFYRAKQKLRKE